MADGTALQTDKEFCSRAWKHKKQVLPGTI